MRIRGLRGASLVRSFAVVICSLFVFRFLTGEILAGKAAGAKRAAVLTSAVSSKH